MQSASPRGSTPDRAGRAKAPAGPLDPAAVAGLYATGAGQVKTQTRAAEVVGTREAGRSGARLMLARAGSWVPIRRGSRGSKLPRPAAARLPTGGRALVMGHDVAREPGEVRRRIGVVFQSPALDRVLTVRENLHVHGRLYGLSGRGLRGAAEEMLLRVRLLDRADDRVGTLSGGLMRRAEIAKGLLHRPRLLLMDEPSSGLDPGARPDLWELLRDLRGPDGATVLLTTHRRGAA